MNVNELLNIPEPPTPDVQLKRALGASETAVFKSDLIHDRLVRVETRLCKLMEHFGLDANGDPQPVPEHGQGTV